MPSNSGTVQTENKPGLAPNNWYFSWDAGLVHYVAMSTELYFGVSGGTDGTLEKMFDWIEEDLAAVRFVFVFVISLKCKRLETGIYI